MGGLVNIITDATKIIPVPIPIIPVPIIPRVVAKAVLPAPVAAAMETVETAATKYVADKVVSTITKPLQIIEDAAQVISSKGVGDTLGKISSIALREAAISSSPLMETVHAVVRVHLTSMQNQADAEGKWKKLPQSFIDMYQEHYSVDLAAVKYAEGINTRIENTAITFPGEIFFPRTIDLLNKEDLHWMLHEMVHLEQYSRVGGIRNYLERYTTDILMKVIQNQTFDVHDLMDYEEEADQKADRLTGSRRHKI